jgi:hypothetical protein
LIRVQESRLHFARPREVGQQFANAGASGGIVGGIALDPSVRRQQRTCEAAQRTAVRR